jgi:hypothetical protein
MEIPKPGEIYYLDPEEGSSDKDEPRPHVVVSLESENSYIVTLAFGTKSDLEAAEFGAAHVVTESHRSLFKATGLSSTTYFYASRLATCLTEEMGEYSGRLIDEFPELRDVQLPRALGLGKGTTWTKGPALGSRRGLFVRFSDDFADELGARFGLVLTEPSYSTKDQLQTIIPVYDHAQFVLPEPAFSVKDASWSSQLSPYQGASFGIQYLQSIFKSDIARYLDEPIDTETLRRVEESISGRLFGMRLIDVLGSIDEDR